MAFSVYSALRRSRRFSSFSMQALIGMLAILPICSSAQRCEWNRSGGCLSDGAACRPVTQGAGTSGHCQTITQTKECACVGQPYPPQTQPPFDILSQGTDANGYLLNPVWVGQVYTGGAVYSQPPFYYADCPTDPWKEPCTTWHPQKIDQGWHRPECGAGAQSSFGGFGRGDYHRNWTEATYEGAATYDEFANDDNDINLKLNHWDNAGLTTWNRDGLQLEFDATETVAHFTTTWWKTFWNAAHREREKRDDDDASQQEKQAARAAAVNLLKKPDGSPIDGIVIGTLGLDCVHSCGSEIHPVSALALHVKDDPNDDVWAIFARNFGNEGYCSEGFLYRPQYNNTVITLPWRVQQGGIKNPGIVYGKAELISSEGAGWSASGKPSYVYTQVKPLSGIVVKVRSDAPVVSGLPALAGEGIYWVEVELHYKWSSPQPLPGVLTEQRERLLASQIRSTVKTISAHPSEQQETEPEKRDLGLTPADRKARRSILEEVKPVKVSPVSVKVVAGGEGIGRGVVRTTLTPVKALSYKSQIIRDPQREDAQKRAAEILRKAHPELTH